MLDPEFAVTPFVYRGVDNRITEITNSPEWLSDDIAGLEEDVRGYERDIERNRALIPQLERETLIAQRDAANAKLKILALQAKLAAQNGGQ